MNNTQLHLSIGVPTLTVILARLSNRPDVNRLSDKFDRLNDALHAEMTAIRNDHHKDNLALMGYMVPLHERLPSWNLAAKKILIDPAFTAVFTSK